MLADPATSAITHEQQGGRRPSRRAAGWVVAVALVAGACGSGGDGDGPAPTPPSGVPAEHTTTSAVPKPLPTDPRPPPTPPPLASQIEAIPLAATKVGDIPMATAIAWQRGDADPYVADQHGEVFHLVDGEAEPVLDLRDQVLDYNPGAESGMLGLAFDPANGRMVVGYNGTDVDTRIVSYALAADGRADPGSAWEILHIEQPGVGHNSGHMAFDRAGNMLISMGDGGGSKGADAQDTTKLLGGLLRITPRRDGPGYEVPEDNPYVGRPDARPEIWAKGMRNPWRFSIDRATGDIWLGDVGESSWEAVYKIPAGEKGVNLGWPTYEGTHRVDYNAGVAPPATRMAPIHEYPHSIGPAIIGGYVYRGTAIPALTGAYVFMDMTGPVWAMGADGVARLDIEMGGVQTSFGEAPDGELYMLTQHRGIFRLDPA